MSRVDKLDLSLSLQSTILFHRMQCLFCWCCGWITALIRLLGKLPSSKQFSLAADTQFQFDPLDIYLHSILKYHQENSCANEILI